MALKLSGYRKYVDPTLTLEVPGRDGVEREYVVPEPSAELGLWCQGVAALPMQIGEETTEAEAEEIAERLNGLPELKSGLTLAQKLMGNTYKQMMADGVTHPTIQHCAGTVFAWIVGGEPAAARFWRRGSGEAPSPANRQERRAATKAAKKATKASSSRTTSTAAAATTQRRASGSGTRSPKKSAARPAKA
jgi:hypothetical protein